MRPQENAGVRSSDIARASPPQARADNKFYDAGNRASSRL
jgi:hypothetical protein